MWHLRLSGTASISTLRSVDSEVERCFCCLSVSGLILLPNRDWRVTLIQRQMTFRKTSALVCVCVCFTPHLERNPGDRTGSHGTDLGYINNNSGSDCTLAHSTNTHTHIHTRTHTHTLSWKIKKQPKAIFTFGSHMLLQSLFVLVQFVVVSSLNTELQKAASETLCVS